MVAAAGNRGPNPGSVTSPGSSRKIITVGSSDLLLGKSGISGRGPTFECVCKPDLVAPGSYIRSCNGFSQRKPESLFRQKRNIHVSSGSFRSRGALLSKYPGYEKCRGKAQTFDEC